MTQLDQSTGELVSVRIVVPMYFHPREHPDEWALLAACADRVRLAILNPAGGPGSGPDPAHHEPLAKLRAADVGIVGYVDTDYGRREPRDVLNDLEKYLAWYEVDGVCFDRAAAGREHLDRYAELARLARAAGINFVLFNHGAHPVEGYAEHADLLGTFEGPWTAYRELAIPRWTRAYPPERFYHVVHSVPPQHVEDAYVLASVRRASSAYVTDRTGANPYDGLPADWLDR